MAQIVAIESLDVSRKSIGQGKMVRKIGSVARKVSSAWYARNLQMDCY